MRERVIAELERHRAMLAEIEGEIARLEGGMERRRGGAIDFDRLHDIDTHHRSKACLEAVIGVLERLLEGEDGNWTAGQVPAGVLP